MAPRFDALFCDDIRQEITGKHILIGVYGGDIVPSVPFPHVTPVSIWTKIVGLPLGEHTFRFKIIGPDAQLAAEIVDTFLVEPNNSESVALGFAGIPITFPKSGSVRALISIDDQPEFELAAIKVTEPRVHPDFAAAAKEAAGDPPA
ncbi:hypothetical protein RFM68_17540 [Mesorhizobium sp. MSK_1335]|uniref:Uncharacterized protein n=1 Tax=Mesorhizobium montanum TaxID=3072323 RepID=A0ABU4ZLQ4_9HYPH|nr:hypothetical protein [Mesorhizobium sp. MSK_1335]MDX8526306.1 hypothetical protein [Mesorhizobium sp. MSK_1335]